MYSSGLSEEEREVYLQIGIGQLEVQGHTSTKRQLEAKAGIKFLQVIHKIRDSGVISKYS